jgi:hypothetical protein
MSTATDILGKVGQKVGTEISTLESNIASTYATQAALNSLSTDLSGVKSDSTDFWVYYADETELNSNYIHGAFAHVHATGYAYYGHNNAWVKLAKFSESATKSELTSAIAPLATQVSLGNVQTELDGLRAGTQAFTKVSGTEAEFGSLKVTGETTIVNTTTVEVSDNVIELNKAEDGTSVADSSGIEVNRGAGNDKAALKWDNLNSKWEFKVGTAVTDLKLDDLEATSVNVPTGSGVTINAVALGDYATFETALLAALSGGGGGGSTADISVTFDAVAGLQIDAHQFAGGGTIQAAPTHLAVLVGTMGNKTPVSGGQTITDFTTFPRGWNLILEGDGSGNYTSNAVLILFVDAIDQIGDYSIDDLQVYDAPLGAFRFYGDTSNFEANGSNLTTGYYFGQTNPFGLTLADATASITADQTTQAFSDNTAEITIA